MGELYGIAFGWILGVWSYAIYKAWPRQNTKVGTPSASPNSAMDAIATQVQTIARNADISPYDRLDKIVTLVMSQRHQ